MYINYTRESVIRMSEDKLLSLTQDLIEEDEYNKSVLLVKDEITKRTLSKVEQWVKNNDLDDCVRDCITPVTKSWGVTVGGDFCETLFRDTYPKCPLNTGIVYEFGNHYTVIGRDWVDKGVAVYFSINRLFLWEELTSQEKSLLIDDYPLQDKVKTIVEKVTKLKEYCSNSEVVVGVGLSQEEIELLKV